MLFQNFNIFSFFIVLSVILILMALLYIFTKNHKKVLEKYPLLLENNTIQKQLYVISACIIVLSLWIFGPSIQKFTENIDVDWLDVMIVLDVSKSMNAEDIQDSTWIYSRMNTAKSLVSNIVINNPKNRYGLVVFAWEAINVSPLTSDSQVFLTFLSWVDYRNVNEQGTDLLAAYSLWLERFIDDENHGKSLLVITDGWDEDDDIDYDSIKKLLRDWSATQSVIGIWTEDWAKIIRGRDIFWDINYEQYKGKDVISKLNKDTLETLADLEGWEYYEIEKLSDLDNFENIFSEIEKKSIEQAWWQNTLDASRYISFLAFIMFIFFVSIPIFRRTS